LLQGFDLLQLMILPQKGKELRLGLRSHRSLKLNASFQLMAGEMPNF